MSTLETNSIGKYSGNNVSIDDPLNLKSYTTAERDGLTSVAGDMIYNSTTSKPQIYNGSAWEDFGPAGFDVDFLVIAGGGGGRGNSSGNYGGGGGGAGGYRTSYGSGNISGGSNPVEPAFRASKSTSYTVTVGGGGIGWNGSDSKIDIISCAGGGHGGYAQAAIGLFGSVGGSGGGNAETGSNVLGSVPNQGTPGGARFGGGGGAGTAGSDGTDGYNINGNGGNGGNGLASSITGSSVTYAGGGGGGTFSNSYGSGGTGGGGRGQSGSCQAKPAAADGAAYLGGGGGGGPGCGNGTGGSGSGGKGVVILKYPNSYTITLAGGASSTAGEQLDGSNKYIQIESTGTVSWA